MTCQNRTSLTRQQLHVSEVWRDGVRTYAAWWTFSPGRVGYGATRKEAINSIPKRTVQS